MERCGCAPFVGPLQGMDKITASELYMFSTHQTSKSQQENIYYVIPKVGPGWLSRYRDSLRTGRFGDRIPVGGRDFPHPSRPPIRWVSGLTQRVKRPGRGVDHPPPSSAEIEGSVELYICSPSGPSWSVLGSRKRIREHNKEKSRFEEQRLGWGWGWVWRMNEKTSQVTR